MSYCLTDQDIAMMLQDSTIYNEPLLDPYLYDVSTDQLSQPLTYASPSLINPAQPETTDWWLWPQQPCSDYSVTPPQELLYLSDSPEEVALSNPYDRIEELNQKIIALECKAERLDELERRFSQMEEAGQHLWQFEDMQRRLCQVETTAESRHIEFVSTTTCLVATDTRQQIRRREGDARFRDQSSRRKMGRAD
jgi:cell fate (sporulation/competence/biofilm development) regulator YlbF (YheA/YmcA/DUF963 family)